MMISKMWFRLARGNLTVLLAIFYCWSAGADRPCQRRSYGGTSIVCVCNSTYCDQIDQVVQMPSSNFVAYSSSMAGLRFEKRTGRLRKTKHKNTESNWWKTILPQIIEPEVTLTVRKSFQHQMVVGFGGTFTDAAGINLKSLSKKTQRNLVETYFGKKGIEFNLCRVPIGGTDFSLHPYAYNSEPEDDVKLSNYTLSPEDFEYKIPFIREASLAATDDVFLIASAWSSPGWMKTSGQIGGSGQLYLKYYQTWADYHVKFLELYDEQNITFWGITTGNEPSVGIMSHKKINSMGMMPWQQAHWIANNFGPTLRNSRFKDIKIFGIDDYKVYYLFWLNEIAQNHEAFKYFDGIATHWYGEKGLRFIMNSLQNIHDHFPNLIILNTEACNGYEIGIKEHIRLGDWQNAEEYMKSILFDFEKSYSGWIEWNLVLDPRGGPNWAENQVDASIIALAQADEFLKQPTFYAMGHLSKFVPRGSVRVVTEVEGGALDNLAFLRPDGGVTIIIVNLYRRWRVFKQRPWAKAPTADDVLWDVFVSIYDVTLPWTSH